MLNTRRPFDMGGRMRNFDNIGAADLAVRLKKEG